VYVSAIIAAGGRGLRFGAASPKQLLMLAGAPILKRSVDAYLWCDLVSEIVVAVPPELAQSPPDYLRGVAKPLTVVSGGDRRRDSVTQAFARVSSQADIVVIHDAARPLVSDDVIRRAITAAAETGAAIAAVQARDTVKRANAEGAITATLPRDQIFLAQTPQAFRVDVLRDALQVDGDATDEAMLAEQAGHVVRVVEGDARNLKITTPDDLATAERLVSMSTTPALRIGNGYDLHRLVAGRPLILGGVTIPFEKGLEAHSDGDALAHAVTDAILGAANAGDIGRHFPDTDPEWIDANRLDLLSRAAAVIRAAGYTLVNIDVVVIAQRPKLLPYLEGIRGNLSRALECEASQISVKGKTNEGVDSMGAGESIAVHAVALLSRVG
jgi:2-C-methyl-D-erythritol 4-phosphate cytidylyltransferase/2-C-methyl-D-erythritol 2,4-cyclodiphosphate synthase